MINSIYIKLILLLLIAILDSIFTVYFIHTGMAIESNPMMLWIIENFSLTSMAVLKIIHTVILIYFILYLLEKSNKIFINKILSYGIISYILIYIVSVSITLI